MPAKAPRACRRPGCGEVTTDSSGFCDAHRKQAAREDPRPAAHARGYDKRWERLRNWYIAQHSLCEGECKKNNVVTAATVVHHVVSVEEDPGRRLSVENLRALCSDCHQAAHK